MPSVLTIRRRGSARRRREPSGSSVSKARDRSVPSCPIMRLLVVNPTRAGHRGRIADVTAALGDVEVRRTEHRGHATELVARASRGGGRLRLLGRRRVQRGAERDRARNAGGLRPRRRRERAPARARPPGRRRSSSRATGESVAATDLGGARERAPLRVLGRDRHRRRGGPPDRGSWPARGRRARGELAFAWELARARGTASRPLRARARGARARPGGLRPRRQRRPLHLRRADSGPHRARGPVRARHRPGRPARRLAVRAAAAARRTRCSAAASPEPATSSTRTTSTGSRSSATRRCRSRPTARISATSPRRCSRRSERRRHRARLGARATPGGTAQLP